MAGVIFKEDSLISVKEKAGQLNQKPMVIWITGLSGAGKSTIAKGLERVLFENGIATVLLDGDNMRRGLNSDLGFSESDRDENIRRVAQVAKLFVDTGMTCIAAFVSPLERHRDIARDIVGKERFFEVFMSTPVEVCMQRDKKNLYAKAKAGVIEFFPGVNSVFESPASPDIVLDSSCADPGDLINKLGDRVLSIISVK
jgi:adenylyl-sulfate kinase